MIGEGFPPGRVSVLHNGIDAGNAPTPQARTRARETLGLPGDAVAIGAVGRLDPVKDFVTLIRAFALVHARLPASRLVIIGGGSEAESLRAEVEDLGLLASVMLTGARNTSGELLPGFDIFANSSIHEGISLTILEAMAASLPVVATKVGGNPEVVDASLGYLVPPRAEHQLAEKLLAPRHRRRHAGRHGSGGTPAREDPLRRRCDVGGLLRRDTGAASVERQRYDCRPAALADGRLTKDVWYCGNCNPRWGAVAGSSRCD